MKNLSLILIAFLLILSCSTKNKESSKPAEKWTTEEAAQWYAQFDWLAGCNFQPSTAINQLEMWQEETFDPGTMDRELGWAEDLGFNVMRVYLHHLAWEVDKEGFKSRMDEYLSIADKHGIKTMFVFFDDCWNATYQAGKQPDPEPGVHNSGWIRDPGDLLFTDTTLMETLEVYVKDVLTTFADDERVLLWDLYNEPGNSGYKSKSMPLLKNVFTWAREIDPSQPLSVGVWNLSLRELNEFQLANSDIVTYHNYNKPEHHAAAIDSLKEYNRPMICTEYMARTNGSTFQGIMPMLKENNIGAINWGFVSGKTNTIFAWNTPLPDVTEPDVWFHDILRKNGTPYSEEEIELIKKLTE